MIGVTFTCSISIDRNEEKQFRKIMSDLKANITAKASYPTLATSVVDLGEKKRVEADDGYVTPIMDAFEERFNWNSGEYEMTVKTETKPRGALRETIYRFVLYESDSKELIDHAEDYKYGDGIYWHSDKPRAINIPITEVERTS